MSPLQFFIISVITIMIQSAPVKRDINENQAAMKTDVQNKLNTLYCAAQSVQRTVATVASLNGILNRATAIHESDINSNTEAVISETFNHFSSKCQNFTLAMSLKHQLQDYLFNQDLNDEDTEELSDQIENLSSLLVALQTMANILNHLQFYNNSSNCPRLSPTEYKMMYQVQYSTTYNNNIDSLLEPIEKWSHTDNYEEDTKPNPMICIRLNLFIGN